MRLRRGLDPVGGLRRPGRRSTARTSGPGFPATGSPAGHRPARTDPHRPGGPATHPGHLR